MPSSPAWWRWLNGTCWFGGWMRAPVIQSERARPTVKTMPPATSDTAPTRNRRIQVSAAGEKICPMGADADGPERPDGQLRRDHRSSERGQISRRINALEPDMAVRRSHTGGALA